jgi:phenylalanyl-tRNA synthetase beta chain
VIEAAHFSARGTARMSRRHRLFSESSYRFEREVDRELPLRASAKAVALLGSLGGAAVIPGCTHAQVEVPMVIISLAADYPGRVAGMAYSPATVIRRLREVGCVVIEPGADGAAPVAGAEPASAKPTAAARSAALNRHARSDHGKHESEVAVLRVMPPSWRPDLRHPSDLAEEVIRLEGYDNVPIRMARAAAGRGLTAAQRTRRAIGRELAGAGYVEVISSPFASAADWDRLQLPADDPRRRATRLSNPLSEDEPFLRTTLLPGLLRVLARNLGRGFGDVALQEMGLVFRPGPGPQRAAPILRVDRGPAVAEIAEIEAALPHQPLRVAVVLAGDFDPAGWWGEGRTATWPDAIEAARDVLRVCRASFQIEADQHAPWHPGRCAAIYVTGDDGGPVLAGHAGELHPRVVQAFKLPARVCAAELDLSVIGASVADLPPAQAPVISAYPVATQDVALVVADSVPAARVEAALEAGAATVDGGSLLEDVALFDIYAGEQVAAGHKSLAYRLRFRAPDRTLTDEETTAARDAAVAEAGRQVGAVLRGEG